MPDWPNAIDIALIIAVIAAYGLYLSSVDRDQTTALCPPGTPELGPCFHCGGDYILVKAHEMEKQTVLTYECGACQMSRQRLVLHP